jgi:hypothetical protein
MWLLLLSLRTDIEATIAMVDSRAHKLNILPFYYLPEAHLSELAAFPLTSSLEDVMGRYVKCSACTHIHHTQTHTHAVYYYSLCMYLHSCADAEPMFNGLLETDEDERDRFANILVGILQGHVFYFCERTKRGAVRPCGARSTLYISFISMV